MSGENSNARESGGADGRSANVPHPAPLPVIGISEYFPREDRSRVELALADMKELGATNIHLELSMADWSDPDAQPWYDWLLRRLSSELDVLLSLLPRFSSTSPASPASAPDEEGARRYAEFADAVLARHARYVEWAGLPVGLGAATIEEAAHKVRSHGCKVMIGGVDPSDLRPLRRMIEAGAIEHADAIGLRGLLLSGRAIRWDESLPHVGALLKEAGSTAALWIAPAGYPTCRYDERRQIRAFVEALGAPVERIYWYGCRDLDPDHPIIDDAMFDPGAGRYGVKRHDGAPKLLGRLWASGGLDAVREADRIGAPPYNRYQGDRPVLITGGSGFVGTNLAHRYLSEGRKVLLYDNLSRPGVEKNLRWLKQTHGANVQIEIADTRDARSLRRAVGYADQVFHLAAQVAVTTSLLDPIGDFAVNAGGTLNLLEGARLLDDPPPIVFTSTNKVYGGLEDVALVLDGARYQPADPVIGHRGIDERRPLDFHSPYGCSKGAADQYIIDYARTFGLKTVVFRMSCIYGLHQFGTEDQGWVAHFLIRAIDEAPITLYGDGMQVRDILFAEDLVEAFLLAQREIDRISGEAFNIGGGPASTISLLELIDLIGEIHGTPPEVLFDRWRPGDQRYYVSDTAKFRAATGWSPQVGTEEGIRRLYRWLAETRGAAFSRTTEKEIAV